MSTLAVRPNLYGNRLRNVYSIFQNYFSKDSPSIKESRSIVTPNVDFSPIINDQKLIETSLSKRGYNENIDELNSLWNSYKSLLNEKSILEEKREANRVSMKVISDSKNKIQGDELKSIGKSLREKFKDVSGQITHIENILIPRILSLPNKLSSKVCDKDIVINSYLEPYSNQNSHLSVGKQLDILEYIDPYTYYLKDIAARYELAICKYIVKQFCCLNFVRLSNPDFSRLPLIQGWIVDNLKKHILTLEKSIRTEHAGLYLNGGANFLMFCALHVNSIVESEKLPWKYVSQGRSYSPVNDSLGGLYNVVQKTSVNFFIGCDETSSLSNFEELTNFIWNLYKSFNFPVRLVYSQTSDLLSSESLRVSFQMFSPYNNRFVEVGNLCKTDDFVSRRLRMYFKDGNDLKFVHVIHGNVVKVPTLVACLLENQPDKSLSLLNEHLNLFEKK